MLLRKLDAPSPSESKEESSEDETLAIYIGELADYERQLFFRRKTMFEQRLIDSHTTNADTVSTEVLIKKNEGLLAQYMLAIEFAKEQIDRAVRKISKAGNIKNAVGTKLQAENDEILKPINQRRLAFDLLEARRGYPLSNEEKVMEARMRSLEDKYIQKEFSGRDRLLVTEVQIYITRLNDLEKIRDDYEKILMESLRAKGYVETTLQNLQSQLESEKSPAHTP